MRPSTIPRAPARWRPLSKLKRVDGRDGVAQDPPIRSREGRMAQFGGLAWSTSLLHAYYSLGDGDLSADRAVAGEDQYWARGFQPPRDTMVAGRGDVSEREWVADCS